MKFEDLIKEKLNGHEYKYTPDKWQKMETLLNSAKPTSGFLSGMGAATKTILIGLTAVSVIGIVSWLSFDNNNTDNQNVNKQTVVQQDYQVVNNKNIEIEDVLSDDCNEKAVASNKNLKYPKTSFDKKAEIQKESDINTQQSFTKLYINEDLIWFMDAKKQELVEDEILPIIAVIPDDGSDYYFIPNPKHKIYDLTEPDKKIERMQVEHKEAKEKKPINKPSKKVFSRKKGLLERLGFKR